MRETDRAQQLSDQCLDDTLEGSLDHPGRYDAGVSVLAALTRRHCIAAHGNTPPQSCSFELTSETRTFGDSQPPLPPASCVK